MQITVEHKTENPLIKRTDITGSVTFSGATPSNKDIAAALVKQLHVDQSLLVIKTIHNDFSFQKAHFQAVVYANAETKKKYEMMTTHLRKKEEELKKKSAEAKGE
ncbi:hypothetical protein HYV86_02625 [Candidatus Woesearchaeota archaeon]|nr:hypothetical protein [Candidatus Woesearchaeota archaeon]